MDVNLLLGDELEIECLVRSLQGDPKAMINQLNGQLELEGKTSALVPKRPHTSAYKAPRREIKICGAKLMSIQEWMKSNVTNNEKEEWIKVRSRLLHVEGRLNRMKYSKIVKSEVDKLLLDCQALLDFEKQAEIDITQIVENNLNDVTIEISEEDDFLETDRPDTHSTFVKEISSESAQQDLFYNPRPGSTKGVNFNLTSIAKEHFPNLTRQTSETSISTNPPQLSKPEDLEKLKKLLASQDLDQLVEILNEVILTKSTLLSTQELLNIDTLCDMSTPPSRTPKKSFVPTRPHASSKNDDLGTSVFNKSHIMQGQIDFSRPPPDVLSQPTNLNQTYVTPSSHNIMPGNHSFNPRYSTFLKRDPTTWGLTFHGSPKDPPIENFLFRVEAIAVGVFHVNLDDLVNEFCAFLKDTAQTWYWTYRQRYSRQTIRYDQFKHDLVLRFRDSRTDFDIRFSINARKQNFREQEEFRKFYDDVLTLVSRLQNPIEDKELLEIIRRNMRPGLQVLLANKQINNLDELVAQCVSLEAMFNRVGYNPEAFLQPKRTVNEINTTPESLEMFEVRNCSEKFEEFDLNAMNMFRPNNSNAKSSRDCPPQNFNPQIRNSNPSNHMEICYNCDKLGHHFRNCNAELKKIFCHGCGEKGIYISQCSKCKVHLNTSERGKSGILPPPTQFAPNPNA